MYAQLQLAAPRVCRSHWPARSRITCINACDGLERKCSKWLFGLLVDVNFQAVGNGESFDNGRLGLRSRLFALSANSKQWGKFRAAVAGKKADRNLHMSLLTTFAFR